MTKRFAAAVTFVSVAAAALAGPVVIDGTDANDHGSASGGMNLDGWLYMQKVLSNLGQTVNPTVTKVLVDLGTSAGQARDAINSAFNGSVLPLQGWTMIHVDGAQNIDSFMNTMSSANTGILYIPTAGEAGGDLDDAELSVINNHPSQIATIVFQGSGLFAQGESPIAVTPWGWLIALLPTVSVTDYGAGGIVNPINLTTAGSLAFPGLTSADLSAGPWHNSFAGFFGGLLKLGISTNDVGQEVSVIIGGGAGTTFTPAPPMSELPETKPSGLNTCITRTSRYWFTHPDGSAFNCATLLRATELNGGRLPIGFMGLAQEFRNADNLLDAKDAVIEALGLYWKSQKRTGESNGTQNEELPGSKLCRARKQLAVELIAAIANNVLLGTLPSNCTFTVKGTVVHFPPDLIDQAGEAAAGDDVNEINNFTTLLKQFNASGSTNNFQSGLVECSPTTKKTLKTYARDPTTMVSCPGINDGCETAEAILSFPFSETVNLPSYINNFPGPSCGFGGIDAVWKIVPPTAAASRSFEVDTFSSNFDTLLSVWSGTSCSTVSEIACNDDAPNSAQSQLTFTTNGTDTYYIVGEGKGGTTGKLKIHVVSY